MALVVEVLVVTQALVLQLVLAEQVDPVLHKDWKVEAQSFEEEVADHNLDNLRSPDEVGDNLL